MSSPALFRQTSAALATLLCLGFAVPSPAEVTSTLHPALQAFVQEAVTSRVLELNAEAGAAVVLDIPTGDILAMAGFSVKNTTSAGNLVLNRAHEPGSVLKLFTIAAVLEEGLATPDTVIDCPATYQSRVRVIKDVHLLGRATVRQIFSQSSNVGTVKLVEQLSSSALCQRLLLFNFGSRVLETPGESGGLLRPLDRWSALSPSSIALGYEMTATALQLTAAVATLANGGIYRQPRLERNPGAQSQDTFRVVSPQTSAFMLDLMKSVVTEGTGKAAALDGWTCGGKTGTTKKVDPQTRKYSLKSYIASFCGVAPLENPRIALCVWIDTPRSDTVYGGTVAAPLFKSIAEQALSLPGSNTN